MTYVVRNIPLVCTAAEPSQVIMAADKPKLTIWAKGGTTGKIQKTVSTFAEITAGTAEWIDCVTVNTAAYADTAKVVAGDESVVAYRGLRGDADMTVMPVWQ